MEATANLHYSVQEGDWFISLVLTDVYPHVQMHSSSRKFFHCGEVFQFCVLPWSLLVSPRVLTHLVDAIRKKSAFGWAERNPKSVLRSKFCFWIHRKEDTLSVIEQLHILINLMQFEGKARNPSCVGINCLRLSRLQLWDYVKENSMITQW